MVIEVIKIFFISSGRNERLDLRACGLGLVKLA